MKRLNEVIGQGRRGATVSARMSTALVCFLIVLAVMIIPASAQSEYRISVGDTIHLQVYGQSELERRATVSGDGKIWVPTLGHIQAAGLTSKELCERLGNVLTMNESIRASDINVDVVEFRPFYIDGAVAKPGAYPFRVGLTVRQAIALAGGFLRAAPAQSDLAAPVDARTNYQSLWAKYAQLDAHAARLRAELEEGRFNWAPPSNFPASREVVRRIARLEEKRFDARINSIQQKKTRLEKSIGLAVAEVAHLEQQQKREEGENKLMSKMLSRLESLREKGLVPLVRLSDYERSASLFRLRLDNTTVQLVRAKRAHQELMGQREQLDLARQDELTSELQGKIIEMQALHSRIIAAANRLLNSNVAIEGVCPTGLEKKIIIERRKNGHNERLIAKGNSEVRPGDVIEVKLPNEALMTQCLAQTLGTARMSAKEQREQ